MGNKHLRACAVFEMLRLYSVQLSSAPNLKIDGLIKKSLSQSFSNKRVKMSTFYHFEVLDQVTNLFCS